MEKMNLNNNVKTLNIKLKNAKIFIKKVFVYMDKDVNLFIKINRAQKQILKTNPITLLLIIWKNYGTKI